VYRDLVLLDDGVMCDLCCDNHYYCLNNVSPNSSKSSIYKGHGSSTSLREMDTVLMAVDNWM
jgi:hypothetical protein